MLDTPLEPWPSFDANEQRIAAEVLASNRVNYWTGTHGREFEREFARATDSEYAIALGNGTLALDLALIALDVGPGDEVIVTPRSYFASTSCVVNRGATPVFVDVDPDSQNLTAATIAGAIGPKTRGILLVHLAGWPCDMPRIGALASERGLWVIEDCAQAHGARVAGRSVGSFRQIGAWSFCQDKIMTTAGEGGMVTTSDRALWRRMWEYKDHGKSWDALQASHAPGFRWLHESFGTNWRMTEIQAAIGRYQLGRLEAWTQRRAENAMRLRAAFGDYPCVRVPWPDDSLRHGWYKFYAFVEPGRLRAGWDRDRVVAAIGAEGVPCYHGSCPEIYREKAFDATPFRPAQRLPVARRLGETSLMMLVHPTLSDASMRAAATAVRRVLDQACGG